MKILNSIVFAFFLFNVSGQDYLLDKYENTYFHHRIEYEWDELGDVYMEYEEAYNIYSSGRNNLNSAKNFANVGAFTIGLGGGAVLLGSGANRFVYGGIVLASGVLIELGALIYFINGKSNLFEARRVFNFEMIRRYGYNTDVSLAFGGTNNGIGLIVQF